jgi:hypothetical protein
MQFFKMASQSECTGWRIISQINIQLSSYSKAYVLIFLHGEQVKFICWYNSLLLMSITPSQIII